MAQLLAAVESQKPVKYTEIGTFSAETGPRTYMSHAEIEGLGLAPRGDQNHVPFYLITDRSTPVRERVGDVQKDTIRIVIDQAQNPDSVVLRPGGLFGQDTVIAGSIDTISQSDRALDLLDLIRTQMRRSFSKIRSYYVGPEAKELFDRGGRLTSSVQSPREYDLTRTS